jgi:hypothetical protein
MSYIVGADFGQSFEYTAFAVLEENPEEHFNVRHLERHRQKSYPALIERLKELAGRLPDPVYLVVDVTGVGRPILESIRRAKIEASPIHAITITGGDSVIHEGLEYKVPKRDLVSTVALFLQNETLKIAKGLKDAPTLERELRNFRAKVSISTAPDTYEAWRDGDHDDLVLAVAIGCWVGQKACQSARMWKAWLQAVCRWSEEDRNRAPRPAAYG